MKLSPVPAAPPSTLPTQPQTPTEPGARYALLGDAQGRVIRLNIITGEVAIVSGSTVVPVVISEERPSPVARAARPPQPGQPAPASAPPAVLLETITPALDRRYVGPTVTITTPSPVFVVPDATRTPLRVLATGSVAGLLETRGDWYRIEFADPRWGPRFGFIEKQGASVNPDPGQPIDLSFRKPKPAEADPSEVAVGKPK